MRAPRVTVIALFAVLLSLLHATFVRGDDASMLILVNQEREKENLVPLTLNSLLTQSAKFQSDYQARVGIMTHENPEGDLKTRVDMTGYKWRRIGENVAWNYPTEEAVMAAWMQSPGHRENIMNPEFREFGYYKTGTYETQNFGTPRDDISSDGSDTGGFNTGYSSAGSESDSQGGYNSDDNSGGGLYRNNAPSTPATRMHFIACILIGLSLSLLQTALYI